MAHTLLAADAIILDKGNVVLIRRKFPPFQGMWSLAGGMVNYRESAESAAVREAKEETNLDVKIKKCHSAKIRHCEESRHHVGTTKQSHW